MSDTSYAGTGDAFVKVDLGDLGTLVIADDGDADPYVDLRVEAGGGRHGVSSAIRQARESFGDDRVAEILQDALGDGGTAAGGPDPTDWGPDPSYKCDGCNTTWPRGTNQTPNAADDTCPECADD